MEKKKKKRVRGSGGKESEGTPRREEKTFREPEESGELSRSGRKKKNESEKKSDSKHRKIYGKKGETCLDLQLLWSGRERASLSEGGMQQGEKGN